jgi:transmembrane sensor
MAHDETIRERALEWAVRAGDPEFTDWDAFTAWLEQSPAHAWAYDEVAAAVADGADLALLAPAAANDDVPTAHPLVRRRWAMGALAASLALVVGLGVWQGGDGHYSVQTAPGETRTLALADGGSVVLSGGSRIELDKKDHRFARLESGQALFTVTHDAANPFAVEVGDDRLVDAGTVFDVELDAGHMQVAVSEGLVVFNPGKQAVKVSPGHRLSKRAGGRGYELAAIDPDEVGEWREGRLTFEDAPLAAVAERLSRITGIAFRAKSNSGGAFSGSLLIAPLRNNPQSLGPLLGVTVRRDGDHWEIAAN